MSKDLYSEIPFQPSLFPELQEEIRKEHPLPISVLTNQAIASIERIKVLRDNLLNEIVSNNFNKVIHIEFHAEPILQNIAELKEDKENNQNYISIDGNFCQFMWSVIAYMLSYFTNIVEIPFKRKMGLTLEKPNYYELEYAEDCFFRGRTLKHQYNPDIFWTVPNPYDPQIFKDFIGKVNAIYCAAFAFIYSHELAHNIYCHKSSTPENETLADEEAIFYLSHKFDTTEGYTYKVGVVSMLSSLLLLGKDISGFQNDGYKSHPHTDDRIETILNKLDLHEMDNLWGYAGTAIRLWLFVYGDMKPSLEDLGPFENYKVFYYKYLNELHRVRNKLYPEFKPIY